MGAALSSTRTLASSIRTRLSKRGQSNDKNADNAPANSSEDEPSNDDDEEDEKTKRRKPASETKVKKSTRFDPARDLPDLSGRVAVVTGGK